MLIDMSESLEKPPVVSPEQSVTSSGQDLRCIGLHPDDPTENCPERATWEVMTSCSFGHEKSGPACSLHKYELEKGMADDRYHHPVTLLYATPI
jgi:hypothetical protein